MFVVSQASTGFQVTLAHAQFQQIGKCKWDSVEQFKFTRTSQAKQRCKQSIFVTKVFSYNRKPVFLLIPMLFSRESDQLRSSSHNVSKSSTQLDCRKVRYVLDIVVRVYLLWFSNSSCLDTRQPGNVFKKLDTRQSEILTSFLEMARLIPLRT